MSKDSDSGKHGSTYEIFMHRAYGIHKPSKPEMQASVMLNLIMAEKASLISKELSSRYDYQLIMTKLYIIRAIDKYIDRPKMTERMAHILTGYKTKLFWAINTDEVMRIVYHINQVKASQISNSEYSFLEN